MTELSYKGANCLVIQTKQTIVIVDPATEGLKTPRMTQKANVILATMPRFSMEPTEGQKLFEMPGEYEIGDLSIKGIAARAHLDGDGKNTTVFRIESSDCTIGVLGHVHAPSFKDEKLEQLGLIDILIIPVGGNGYTIDAHDAAVLTRHIDPKIVVPVHFLEDDVNYEVSQASIELFIKEMGVTVETEPALRIKQPGQLPETLTVVRLDQTS